MKYKTRRSLAAAMVDELVDTNTRIISNVNGRGRDKETGTEKLKLDPNIIAYVRRKVFEAHPSDKLSIWKRTGTTVIKIDDQGREIKRLKLKGLLEN